MTQAAARVRVAFKRKLRLAGVPVRNDATTAEFAADLRSLRRLQGLQTGRNALGF